ncbi:Ribokinase-like protein [Bisporella sp. PMI_857]|nr:Ribokinase-like protein [Bisporella sp. PMI_857]
MEERSSITRFVSLGMVVLDELRLPNGQVKHNCIGGSGAYSTIGARLITSPSKSKEIGSFILAGHDFPAEILDILRGWGLSLVVEIDRNRDSTRGILEYHDEAFGRKSFHYITTPLQPTPRSLPAELLSSKSFHLLRAPEAIRNEVEELLQMRKEAGLEIRPLLVWEPLPGQCTHEYLDAHITACKSVDVFSPNHLELLALLGDPTFPFNPRAIEACADSILHSSQEQASVLQAVVVRAGEHGCLTVSNTGKKWFPPLLSPDKVVDATGGGNTFLGAFTLALQVCGDVEEAAIQATVAASFAIEQIGMPMRAIVNGQEMWNGVRVNERLEIYRDSLKLRS